MRKMLNRLLMACMITALWVAGACAGDAVGEYELGSGDKIKIHVFGEPDLDMEVSLGSSGNIRYPFLGKIHIAGLKTSSLEHLLTVGLADGYLVSPQVRVSIEEFRPFFVNGDVRQPGAYPYKPGLNARKAISLAGGFNDDADKNKIFLIHAKDKDKHEEKISLASQVLPGDIIIVKHSFFFVNGEVENPGKYAYHEGMTYRKAIAMGGGMKERADEDKIYVVHDGQGEKMQHVNNIDAEIQAGDVVIIKQGLF